VERGEKTFEVFLGNDFEPQPGDLLTMEEWDPDTNKYTSRGITRKVTHVLNTKRAQFSDDDVQRHGLTVCGLVHPDLNTLRALLHEAYIASVIIERQPDGKQELLTGPFYLPPMSAPPAYEMGLFDDLHAERWPEGIYDITISIYPDPKRDRFVIIDQLINGAVNLEDGSITAIELSYEALLMGKVKDTTGRQLQMADPMEVKSLNDIDDDNVTDDSLLPMRLDDGLARRVDEELDELLEETRGEVPEGYDDEDDEEYNYAD
jgi:hypothetical protein